MKYEILGSDNVQLSEAINEGLSNGWQLYGTPFGVYDKNYEDVIIYQAMIKEEE